MPQTSNGKKYIITAIDYATQWPVAQAVKNHTGNDIRRFIGREIIAKFGQPELLITDGGRELVANQTNAYLAKSGVEHIVTTPYHPQANGRVKRLNASLIQALAKLTAGQHADWSSQLPTALLVCCTCTNRSTNAILFELVYGRKPDITQTNLGPRLEEPERVPPRANHLVKSANKKQEALEAKRIQTPVFLFAGDIKLVMKYG